MIKLRVPLTEFKGHIRAIYSLAFSPDGRILASRGNEKVIRLWDVEKRHLRLILEGHKGFINSINFSPDGKILASGGTDKAIIL